MRKIEKTKKISGIYKMTIGDQFYIGATSNLYHRRIAHLSQLKRNDPLSSEKCRKQFRKFGEDGFKFEILEYIDVFHLEEREQYYMDLLNPTLNGHGKAIIAQQPWLRKNNY